MCDKRERFGNKKQMRNRNEEEALIMVQMRLTIENIMGLSGPWIEKSIRCEPALMVASS